MTTAAKLYGKDLSEYDDIDVDKLLAELTPEELNILAKEVDPDVSLFILKTPHLTTPLYHSSLGYWIYIMSTG